MLRLVNLIFFVGCALAVARYSGLGTTTELLGVLVIAAAMMLLLSRRRTH